MGLTSLGSLPGVLSKSNGSSALAGMVRARMTEADSRPGNDGICFSSQKADRRYTIMTRATILFRATSHGEPDRVPFEKPIRHLLNCAHALIVWRDGGATRARQGHSIQRETPGPRR